MIGPRRPTIDLRPSRQGRMRCGGTGLDCHTITNAPHAKRATGGVIAFMRPCRDAAFNGDTLHGGHRPPPIFIGPYRARKQVIPTMIGPRRPTIDLRPSRQGRMRCGGTGLDCTYRDATFNGDTLHGGHRPACFHRALPGAEAGVRNRNQSRFIFTERVTAESE